MANRRREIGELGVREFAWFAPAGIEGMFAEMATHPENMVRSAPSTE